jgi:hypothetical protein
MQDPLDQLLFRHLADPEAAEREAEGLRVERTALSLRYPVALLGQPMLPALGLSFAANAAAISLLRPLALQLLRRPLGLDAVFAERKDALEGILLLQETRKKSGALHFSAGLAAGPGLQLGDEWMGMSRLRAERLASMGSGHSLLADRGFTEGMQPPPGIGWHQARSGKEEAVGFAHWEVADYRGE